MTRAPDRETIDRLKGVVGPKGEIAGDALAPLLEEWRGRWRGETPLALAPATTAEVAAIVKICAAHRIAITPQGGNTGLVGGQTPNGEILLSLRRLARVRDVSPLNDTMTLEAGVTLADAQAVAQDVDRLFPLSIGSEGSCQIGGVISTNAGGVNVLRYGSMRSLVLGVEAVLPNGEIWNGLRDLRKDNTGLDLKQLFIGAEGVLGVVTAAVLRLFPAPKDRVTCLAGLPDLGSAVSLLARAQAASGGQVSSFEVFSRDALALVLKNIPGARDPLEAVYPWYGLIEVTSGRAGGLRDSVEAFLADALEAGEVRDAVIADSDAAAAALWRVRHAMSEAMKPEGRQAKHDIAVAVADVPAFIEAADAAVAKVCAGARVIAFGHIGDGNIHYDVMRPADMESAAFDEEIPRIETAVYAVVDGFGGSISAEHGVGLARRDEIARRKDPAEMAMMRAVKRALDPDNIMNPGKMLALSD